MKGLTVAAVSINPRYSKENRTMTKEEAEAEGRLIFEVSDADGNLVEQSFGPSSSELLVQHLAGECSSTYSWCHQVLADKIGEDAAVSAMYQRCFGEPMPTVKH